MTIRRLNLEQSSGGAVAPYDSVDERHSPVLAVEAHVIRPMRLPPRIQRAPSRSPQALALMSLGVVLGVIAMYFGDPRSGARRRAGAKQTLQRMSKRSRRMARGITSETRHGFCGVFAEAKHALQDDNPNDALLRERVRAHLGRVASNPRVIQVKVTNRRVHLTGDVPADEENRIVETVRRVRGVSRVENDLAPRRPEENASS